MGFGGDQDFIGNSIEGGDSFGGGFSGNDGPTQVQSFDIASASNLQPVDPAARRNFENRFFSENVQQESGESLPNAHRLDPDPYFSGNQGARFFDTPNSQSLRDEIKGISYPTTLPPPSQITTGQAVQGLRKSIHASGKQTPANTPDFQNLLGGLLGGRQQGLPGALGGLLGGQNNPQGPAGAVTEGFPGFIAGLLTGFTGQDFTKIFGQFSNQGGQLPHPAGDTRGSTAGTLPEPTKLFGEKAGNNVSQTTGFQRQRLGKQTGFQTTTSSELPELNALKDPRTERSLYNVHPTLRDKTVRVLQDLERQGFKPSLSEGRRSKAEALRNFRRGVGSKTSRHIPGYAIDFFDQNTSKQNPGNINIHDYRSKEGKAFWSALGKSAKKHGLQWGGDWRKPDRPHVQIPPNERGRFRLPNQTPGNNQQRGSARGVAFTPEGELSQDFINKVRTQEGTIGKDNARSPTGAQGPFQFTSRTWKAFGKGDPNNLQDATKAMTKLTKFNRRGLKRALGRQPTDAELYMAHNIGLTGARKLLTADPNARLTRTLIGSNPRHNPKFLMNKGRAVTAGEARRRYYKAFGEF